MNKHLKECIKYLDLDKVQRVMLHLDWRRVDVGVPTKEDMKKTIISLYKGAKLTLKNSPTEECISYATGGFQVRVGVNKDRKVDYVSVKFVVTDWDSYDETTNNS